jgi:hypothetical protein
MNKAIFELGKSNNQVANQFKIRQTTLKKILNTNAAILQAIEEERGCARLKEEIHVETQGVFCLKQVRQQNL